MSMKNKIKKRLVKLNGFLVSDRKPGIKVIHALRLEVKHLEAFLELMTIQNNFGTRPGIPNRLEKLYHEAGRVRKFGLETKAIRTITVQNRLTKPTLYLKQLNFSKEKSGKKLRKKRKQYPVFKPRDFARHPGARLTSETWRDYMAGRASSILDLLKQDILSDVRSLHELRKILKSILYVLPVSKKEVKPVRVFLQTRKRFMESVESTIGSMHDIDFFVRWLEKKHDLIPAGEEDAMKRIKREWQHDMVSLRKELKPLLPAVRQFAHDLRDRSMVDPARAGTVDPPSLPPTNASVVEKSFDGQCS